ncbi:hypothetical protein CANINC_004960 [Pichia inconspicua]|uniref:Enoyl reductase (ER) domain-containing protein n=1 Tax=Pichia inconspicua TaxID=52247 RepID=A0A4T0WUN0_9ASCO|nr:hypothetical protein CANINC_004960 [[Candida] inconspicua]
MSRVVYTGDKSPLAEVITIEASPDDYILRPTDIVVHVKAAAVIPADIKMITLGITPKGAVLGCEYAGIVHRIGSDVQDLVVGDFVTGFVLGNSTDGSVGAFQDYTVASAATAIKVGPLIHENSNQDYIKEGAVTTFEGAVSVSASILTVGLSLGHYMQIKGKEHAGKWILIWGGTASTGFLAIQVAKKLYGLKVITVANRKKYGDRLIAVGADVVVDYHDDDVVAQIKSATNDSVVFAYDVVSNDATNHRKVFDAVSDTLPSKVHNLNSISLKFDSSDDQKKQHVEFSSCVAFLLTGDDIPLWGLKRDESIFEDGISFKRQITPLLTSGEIIHMPVHVHLGLDNANDALLNVQKGVSFTKEVIRLD